MGRAAFLTRTIARDAEFGFRLSRNRRMRHQARKNRLSGRRNKKPPMNQSGGDCLPVRALLARRLKLRITARQLSALRHAHHAVMLSVATATRRQVRLARGIPRQEWLDERLAQESQQHNGKQFTQC